MSVEIGIAALITAVGAAVALVIKTITTSRCTAIDCCGIICSRDVLNSNVRSAQDAIPVGGM